MIQSKITGEKIAETFPARSTKKPAQIIFLLYRKNLSAQNFRYFTENRTLLLVRLSPD
jgi:hypothetical protein